MNGNRNGFLSLDRFDNVLFIILLVVTCVKGRCFLFDIYLSFFPLYTSVSFTIKLTKSICPSAAAKCNAVLLS